MKSALSVLLIVLFCQVSMAEQLPEGILKVEARPAPLLQLADMDGNQANLSSSRGNWAFVHFWASWCGPCRREMPAIERLVSDMQDKQIDFYIVNTAEDEDTVFEFLAAAAPELNSLLDRDGLATEKWRPRGLPATYLVDPQGVVRYQALGGRDWHKAVYQEFLLHLIAAND